MASGKQALSLFVLAMTVGCGEVATPTLDAARSDAASTFDAIASAIDAPIPDAPIPDAALPDALVPDAGPPACTGTVVGGHCWHKGVVGQSCLVVCASFGVYDSATVTFAGATADDDRSNVANCAAIVLAFSAATFSPTTDNINETDDYGCVEEPAKSRSELVSVNETTPAGDNPLAARFCACTF